MRIISSGSGFALCMSKNYGNSEMDLLVKFPFLLNWSSESTSGVYSDGSSSPNSDGARTRTRYRTYFPFRQLEVVGSALLNMSVQ